MQSGMLLIWIGALLIIGGIVLAAGKVLWKGRLSDPHRVGSGATLEPQGRAQALPPEAPLAQHRACGVGSHPPAGGSRRLRRCEA